MYSVKSIMNRTGANGTRLSHEEKEAFVSRNQQENALTTILGLYTPTSSLNTLVNIHHADKN